jgi:hypothetical protein
MPSCPSCGSQAVVKNGFIHNGTQNHKCKACGLQFVEVPKQKLISQSTKELIDKLLLEKIPLAGIARVCNVSETWLQEYVILTPLGLPSVSPSNDLMMSFHIRPQQMIDLGLIASSLRPKPFQNIAINP